MNIVNSCDIIGYVPLSQWGFKLYGSVISRSLDSGSKAVWLDQTGKDSYNAAEQRLILQLTNRIYKNCCQSWDNVYDRAGKQLITEEQKNGIPERALRYCDITDHDAWFSDNKYELYPSLAFVFQLGAEGLGDKKTVVRDGKVQIEARPAEERAGVGSLAYELWNSKYAGAIAMFAVSNIGDVAEILKKWSKGMDPKDLAGDGHLPETYYVLIQ